MRHVRTPVRTLAGRAGLVVSVAVSLVCGLVAGAAPASAATYDKPVAGFAIPDPGVMHDGSRWVVLSTGAWDKPGHIATAKSIRGPWKKSKHHLLTKRPAWASKKDHSVWAPSVISTSPGQYAVFYAAVVARQTHSRCIGVGTGQSPTGPFIPNPLPVSCYQRSGARADDRIPSEGKNFSLIDPTPAWVSGQLVLTYKTQFLQLPISGTRPSAWSSSIRPTRVTPPPTRSTPAGRVSRSPTV